VEKMDWAHARPMGNPRGRVMCVALTLGNRTLTARLGRVAQKAVSLIRGRGEESCSERDFFLADCSLFPMRWAAAQRQAEPIEPVKRTDARR